MDVDYDATVYFLYRKHDGDWEKIEHSFRAFLRFAATLGGEAAEQLAHVDPMMYTRAILEHRVEYFEWKMGQRRAERRARRQQKQIPEDQLEDDIIFGGKARPSGHNVLKHNLGCSLDKVVESVKTMLPTLAAAGEDSDDDDSADGELPEVFFSGIDWSKVQLPGDDGFSWESPPRPAAGATTSAAEKKLQIEEEIAQLEGMTMPSPLEVMQSMGLKGTLAAPAKCTSPPKAAAATQQAKAATMMNNLLPGDVLPSGNTYATLQSEMGRLNALEGELASGRGAGGVTGDALQSSLKSGDLTTLKRLLNPSRPKRPSEMHYDSDGNPLKSDDERAHARDSDDDDDEGDAAADPTDASATLFDEVLAKALVPESEKNPKPAAQVNTSIFDDAAAAAAAARPAAAAATARANRFDAFEHSSDSDDDEEAVDLSRAGYRGKGGGYAGKGGKAGGDYAGKGMKGRVAKP